MPEEDREASPATLSCICTVSLLRVLYSVVGGKTRHLLFSSLSGSQGLGMPTSCIALSCAHALTFTITPKYKLAAKLWSALSGEATAAPATRPLLAFAPLCIVCIILLTQKRSMG